MCVILFAEETRAAKGMVEDAWERNSHGGGAAWREKGKDGKVVVKWRKGLSLEEMIDLAEKLPLPHVLHFRIASSGGVCEELCHPFLINPMGANPIEGETNGAVLFHNGDWRSWRDVMLNAAIRKGVKIPKGKLSDTRVMAWLTSIYGDNFMEAINEKGVVFSPDDIQIFLGSQGWKTINGVFCSNDYFFHGSKRYKMCITAGCKTEHGIDSNGLCWQCRNKKSQETQALVKRDGVKVGDVVLNQKGEHGGISTHIPFQALIRAAEKEFLEGKMSKKQLKKLKKRYMKEAEAQWRDVVSGNQRARQILH